VEPCKFPPEGVAQVLRGIEQPANPAHPAGQAVEQCRAGGDREFPAGGFQYADRHGIAVTCERGDVGDEGREHRRAVLPGVDAADKVLGGAEAGAQPREQCR
jgi:hypothetical protein